MGDASRLTPPDKPGLLRVLGLGFGIAAVLGDVIGSGILRTPGVVAAAVPDPTLILTLWLIGGLMCLIDALVWIELASSIPKAGGPYAYAERAFGPLAGFLTGWTDFLVQVSSSAFIAVAFAEYAERAGLSGGLNPGVIAVTLALALGVLNALGTKIGGWTSIIGSAAKALLLIGLIAMVFTAPATATSATTNAAIGVGAIIAGLRAIHGTYSGWMTPVYFAEEIHEPHRNMARSMLTGIVAVTLIYVAINAGLLHALSLPEMAASKLPVADAASKAMGAGAGVVVTLAALVLVGTIANLQTMFTPRITFAMARDGLLPRTFASVSPNGSPQASLWLGVVFTAVLAASGAYETLLAIYAPLAVLVQALVVMAAIKLRRSEPDLPRPFRMPLYPLPAIVALIVNIVLAIAFTVEDFASARWSILLLVLPLPLYWWSRRRAA